ncbi:hypothetical protein F2981_33720 (plasmid) [Sinorhizobium meliloti]|nr:hypothetical protein [Sinorhizobium meliloti]
MPLPLYRAEGLVDADKDDLTGRTRALTGLPLSVMLLSVLTIVVYLIVGALSRTRKRYSRGLMFLSRRCPTSLAST